MNLQFNPYARLAMYASMFVAGLIPAWASGWLSVGQTGVIAINLTGLALAFLIAIVGSFAVFAKWGIRPMAFSPTAPLFGQYLRVITYSLTWLIGLIPANFTGIVTLNLDTNMLYIDPHSFAVALGGAFLGNFAIFQAFGVKRPPAST